MRAEPWIPLEACQHGGLYRLNSRNLRIGVWDAERGWFVGIRTKWGARFLDAEWHWDAGAPRGTAQPVELLGRVAEGADVRDGWAEQDEEGERRWVGNRALFDWLQEEEVRYGER